MESGERRVERVFGVEGFKVESGEVSKWRVESGFRVESFKVESGEGGPEWRLK